MLQNLKECKSKNALTFYILSRHHDHHDGGVSGGAGGASGGGSVNAVAVGVAAFATAADDDYEDWSVEWYIVKISSLELHGWNRDNSTLQITLLYNLCMLILKGTWLCELGKVAVPKNLV